MKVKNVLTIVIPTLNNTDGLIYLLDYFKNKPYKIVVVDNKKKNLGFAGGVNKGVEDVKTKWMLILNDDIEFSTDPIKILIQYAEEKKLDAVSPILRNPNGEVENYGYKVLPYGKIELVREMDSRLRGNDSKGHGNDNNIDGITAACLLVRTEVFRKLGGFDEKFFAYLEDVDFFLRMKKMDSRLRGNDSKGRGNDSKGRGNDSKGRGNDRLPFGIAYDIEVLHNHMTTSKTMGNFKARQDMVNWWRLFFKHPEKFKFNLDFIIERLRNVSGYLKATFKSM